VQLVPENGWRHKGRVRHDCDGVDVDHCPATGVTQTRRVPLLHAGHIFERFRDKELIYKALYKFAFFTLLYFTLPVPVAYLYDYC